MILAILQARASSTRLPGKVLAPVFGKPMILRQIERISRATKIDKLVVATSTESSDDELASMLSAAGVEVWRGSLNDVFERFALVIDDLKPEHVVRLTADCPLTDPVVIDLTIQEHVSTGADYTSNTNPPTYPDGLDVEVFSVSAFNELRKSALTAPEREHVTLGFRDSARSFTCHNVSQSTNHEDLRWTVDLPEDLEFVRAIYAELYEKNPSFGQAEILGLLEFKPELSRTSSDAARNAALGNIQ